MHTFYTHILLFYLSKHPHPTPHTLADQPPPTEGPVLSNAVIGVIGGVIVLVVSVVVIGGVLLGKRKLRAKIWRPHSPASSENDGGSSSQGTDGRRRGSQAGGAVTGTEPSGLQYVLTLYQYTCTCVIGCTINLENFVI